MEGLEVTILKSTEFLKDNFDFRLDAEYFLNSNLENLKTLNQVGYKKVSDFGYVTDGIHSSIDYCDDSNINLFSATTPRENYFDLTRQVFISKEAHKLNPRTALKENDIIISTVGTIGNCAVVNKSVLPANSDRHVGIIRLENKDFYPRYISTFLLSKYGRFQTWRESTGNVQFNLFLYRIRTLKIANLTKPFQEKIENLVLLNDLKRSLSKETYANAENILLQEIGLQDFEPSKEPVNVKSFKESFGATGRLDAEYYQPKYEAITKAIKDYKNGFSTLESFIKNYSTGFPYKSETYSETVGIPLIRINNISKGNLDLSNAVYIPFNDIDLSEKDIANENDILISMSGTIGNSCKIRKGIKAVVNQRIMRFSPQNYNVDVLPLIINSIIGQSQLERIGTGGVQTNISATDIKEILIPIINPKEQEQISELVEESFRLKKESERLLEVAKRAVEMAIETDEDTAMQWIADTANK